MKRLLALFLIFSTSLTAKPWHHDWKFWAVAGSNLLASGIAIKETHDCRMRETIAFCNGGYGPFAARSGVNFGTAAGFDILAAWGHDHGVKEWPMWAAGLTGYNAYVAYDQTLKGCPKDYWPVWGTKFTCTNGWSYENNSEHSDLSRVVFVRRK
jgi:hypothetical protein